MNWTEIAIIYMFSSMREIGMLTKGGTIQSKCIVTYPLHLDSGYPACNSFKYQLHVPIQFTSTFYCSTNLGGS